jgi:hypothetical protein
MFGQDVYTKQGQLGHVDRVSLYHYMGTKTYWHDASVCPTKQGHQEHMGTMPL